MSYKIKFVTQDTNTLPMKNINKYIEVILKNENLKNEAILKIQSLGLNLRDDQAILLFAQLTAQKDDINNISNNFYHHFEKLISLKEPTRERVILLHLIIENYFDKYFKIMKIPSIPKKNTFLHKLQLLSSDYGPTFIFHKGIIEINKIRNKYAHNINYSVLENDITEIKNNKFLKNIFNNFDFTKITNVELIEKFTEAVCMSIDISMNNKNRKYFKRSFPSYKDYL